MPYLIKASSNKQVLWPAVKLLTLLALLLFIYLKLEDQEKFADNILINVANAFSNNGIILIFILLLMPVNWGLEAVKWKVLAAPIADLKLVNALKGVLAGLSLSFMTPHGIGDYVGRVMQDDSPQRGRYIGAILLGRFCQMLPTALFGLIGIYYLLQSNMVIFLGVGILLINVLLLVIFARSKAKQRLGKPINTLRKKINYYFGVIGAYSLSTLLNVLVLSIFRYMVFAIQFALILYVFLPAMEIDLNIAGVTWIFLSKSVLPSFNFLSDLGVREFSAVYFFDHFNVDLLAVVNASLILWVINILLPTIIGAPLTLKMKLKTK